MTQICQRTNVILLGQSRAWSGSLKLRHQTTWRKANAFTRHAAAEATDLASFSEYTLPQFSTAYDFPTKFVGPSSSRLTTLDSLGDGAWSLTQPFYLFFGLVHFDVRATLVRLQDGTLWVHAPVPLTEQARKLVGLLGCPVGHIVVPNTAPEHSIFAPEWAAQYPDAQLWLLPGFEDRPVGEAMQPFQAGFKDLVKSRPVKRLEEGTTPEEWGGEISIPLINEDKITEAIFYIHKHQALTACDMFFAFTRNNVVDNYHGFRLVQLISMLRGQKQGKVICIFAKGGEKEERMLSNLGKVNARLLFTAHLNSPVPIDQGKLREALKLGGS